jgi:hypothetical protein
MAVNNLDEAMRLLKSRKKEISPMNPYDTSENIFMLANFSCFTLSALPLINKAVAPISYIIAHFLFNFAIEDLYFVASRH